jgi:RNA polymerase sigma-70 factor (ECF subfamily)
MDPSERSDADLVRETRAGSHEAYRALVTRYQGHVYGLAYSLVGNWAEAQDLAQETFIRVHSNLDQLRDTARFAPWLRRVTFSVTMNWLRAFKPQRFEQLEGRAGLDGLDIPSFEPGPGELAERRELADAVLAAIGSLPPKYRVPLTMFHLDGLSYEKVAEFLDIPLGTAKSLIHRARAQLKEALGAVYAEETTPMVKEVLDAHRLPAEFAGKVVGGLERARWGAGERENSVIGALAAALDALGEDVSYEELMGLSGAAFRIQMHEPRWCPSAPHANCGFPCHRTVLDALGYELVVLPVGSDDPGARERARRAVMESIDRGVPAFYSSEEESLVVGYDHAGRRLLLRCYGARDEGYAPWWLERPAGAPAQSYPESFVHERPFLGLGVLRSIASRPDPLRARRRSLELALELSRTERYGPYRSGFAAYRFWIEGLRDPACFADPRECEHRMGANGHCYYSLYDARRAAGLYLQHIAGDFGPPATPHLERAAALYLEIADGVLKQECVTRVAPMPWMVEGGAWSQTQRDAEAALLERAMSLERNALAEIEGALGAR